MQRVNVAIASPGDVDRERDAILKVFTRWNDAHDHAFLHPVMWEYSSVPTLGDHPQHLLNEQIIERSDLLIAIFWSRLGTPTPTADSGTVEEIREVIKRKGPECVMLYFCKRSLPYDIDPNELARLRKFRPKCSHKDSIANTKRSMSLNVICINTLTIRLLWSPRVQSINRLRRSKETLRRSKRSPCQGNHQISTR